MPLVDLKVGQLVFIIEDLEIFEGNIVQFFKKKKPLFQRIYITLQQRKLTE
ncbi:hypothetical protein LG298_07425 [Cytobacillus firmus]|uniref:hypothetical protein n=1 Tax=Cytobacillus firmus TaxID=1399 RepID=UPI00384E257F